MSPTVSGRRSTFVRCRVDDVNASGTANRSSLAPRSGSRTATGMSGSGGSFGTVGICGRAVGLKMIC